MFFFGPKVSFQILTTLSNATIDIAVQDVYENLTSSTFGHISNPGGFIFNLGVGIFI